ncbi:hypothetical protein PM082_005097 [Marasmius tenuissimus]|nr:hypothetical protein PM082_005097 [Marasmius tenuissimus]
MELNGNDRDSAGSRVPDQLREHADSACAVPMVPPEYIGWEASSAVVLFNRPKPNAWSICTSTVADVAEHPLGQPVVVQQVLQLSEVTLDPTSSRSTPVDFPHRYQRFGDHINGPHPLPLPDLTVMFPASAEDPSPA